MTWLQNTLLGLCLAVLMVEGGTLKDEQILHVRYDGRYWQIWTMDTRGEHAAQLTQSRWDKRNLMAVPGTREALCRDNQGKLFRFRATDGQLIPVNFEGLEVVKDYDLDPQRGYLIASYAPNATDNIRIWWYSPEGREKRLVIADPHLNEIPRWLPRREAFVFVKSHQGQSRICLSDWQRPQAKDILVDPFANHTEPAPHPRGAKLAYCRETSAGMDLWLAQWDGSQPRSVYAGAGMETDPCWSLQGDRLYFATWDGHHFRIASVDSEGRDFTLVSSAGVDGRYPACIAAEP